MKAPQIVKITDLNLRANGISYQGKNSVEVPFTLPDETCEVRVVEQKGAVSLALPTKITKESPFRKKKDCIHYGTCGACHYRHVRYNKSLQIKEALFYRELEKLHSKKQDLTQVLQTVSIVPAPNPKYYRNNVRFYNQDKKLMQHTMLTHRDFEVKECFVVSESTWEVANKWKWKLPNSITEVEIRENEQGQQMCILSGVTGSKVPLLPVYSQYFFDTEQKTYTHISGEQTLTHHMEISGRVFDFEIGPDSFFQVNTAVAQLLYHYISKVVPRTGSLYDLYSGTGTIGLILAKLYPELQVTSIEVNAEMVEMAKKNAVSNSIENITFLKDDVRTLRLEAAPDSILLDPPRNGLQKESLEHLCSLGSQSIVYVSCNPATFLRDAEILFKAYTLKHVRLFDMMPYTSHMEVVGVFEKR